MKKDVCIRVKLIPNASKDEIVEAKDGCVKIKIRQPPVDGKANKALIKFLSEKLNISKSRIKIISGYTSRMKTISIGNR